MECGIQFGHGMQAYSLELIKAWNGGSVILGPRNFYSKDNDSRDKLIAFSNKLKEINAETYIDPQLFSTRSPQKHLAKFSHCQLCRGDLKTNYSPVIKELSKMNLEANTNSFILPSHTLNQIDSKWANLQNNMIDLAEKTHPLNRITVTIALTSNALRDQSNIQRIVRFAEQSDVTSFYIVCEHPKNEYLTDDTLWLINLLYLVAELKLSGKHVFVGYASHQQLMLVITKCDAIFVGNFLNMRRFCTDDFSNQEDEGIKNRSRWYYAAQLLSELRIVTLDVAKQSRVLDKLEPYFDEIKYAHALFKADIPSQSAYSEKDSFLHYLSTLRKQCQQYSLLTYDETFNSFATYLKTASDSIVGMREKGIFDRNRSYLVAMDATENAISAFNANLGTQMKLEWDYLM